MPTTRKLRGHEVHLAIHSLTIPAGGEWTTGPDGWTVALVGQGNGYCRAVKDHVELPAGAMLIVPGHAKTVIRASQLGEMLLHTFNLVPTRLPGLITMGEQDSLKQAAARDENIFRLQSPESPVARRFQELCARPERPGGLLLRLQLLQLFVEALDAELQTASAPPITTDARERLQELLRTTAPSELAEMSFSELARRIRCTSRHLSRIFNELTGMSFREKRAEIRMARARELLAGGNSKVVEIALESGYKSLSLFNLMFTRRFGTSPGRWRQKYISLR